MWWRMMRVARLTGWLDWTWTCERTTGALLCFALLCFDGEAISIHLVCHFSLLFFCGASQRRNALTVATYLQANTVSNDQVPTPKRMSGPHKFMRGANRLNLSRMAIPTPPPCRRSLNLPSKKPIHMHVSCPSRIHMQMHIIKENQYFLIPCHPNLNVETIKPSYPCPWSQQQELTQPSAIASAMTSANLAGRF